jgi:hypothetical protein
MSAPPSTPQGTASNTRLLEKLARADLKVSTDAEGNVVVRHGGADWTVRAEERGFVVSRPMRVGITALTEADVPKMIKGGRR